MDEVLPKHLVKRFNALVRHLNDLDPLMAMEFWVNVDEFLAKIEPLIVQRMIEEYDEKVRESE